MSAAPIILVPGFWLGAWAWDDVVRHLAEDGLTDVTALTLPGLASIDSDRTAVSLEDHVGAVVQAVQAAGRPVVLVPHSGASVACFAASDRVPDLVAAMVYLDTRPERGPIMADFAGHELPLWSPEELAANESLAGLSEEMLAEFRARAVPEPGAILRDEAALTDPRRLSVPTTMVCTSFPVAGYQSVIAEGQPWVSDLAELQHVTWVDLPTSHWPMWSRPREVADILRATAEAVG